MHDEDFKREFLNTNNIEGLFAFDANFTVYEDTVNERITERLNEKYKNCTLDDAIRIINESSKDDINIQEIGGIIHYDFEYFYVVNIGTEVIDDIGVLTIVYNVSALDDVIEFGSFTEGVLHNKLHEIKDDIIDFLRQNDLHAIETLLEM